MREEFIQAIKKHQSGFDLDLPARRIEALGDYYELVRRHNPLLHLVAPCPPEEFAVRHVLESLTLLEFLPERAGLADIGAGAGLPSVPCLIVRAGLRVFLVESKPKKAAFLENVLKRFDLDNRAAVFNRQFEELPRPAGVSHVTCRALDKFTRKLPKILRWAGDCQMLLFGGNNLARELDKNGISYRRKLMPGADRRFLFVAGK